MKHLSALDALFLYIETPETPMHVGSLILLEKPKGHKGKFFPKIRQHIVSRLHLASLFTRKLAFMPMSLANPIWVDDNDMDLDWHIQSYTLPKPGTRAQLDAAVAELHEGMLDRDRPLWQFVMIEGLQSGEVALYAKLHHAGMDGQGGVALARAILDVEPNPKPIKKEKADAEKRLPPSAAKMLSAAFRNSVAQYGKIISAVPGAVKSLGAMGMQGGSDFLSSSQAKLMGAPSEQLTGVMQMAELAGKVSTIKTTDSPLQAVKKLLPAGIKLGPRTPFNVAIGAKRAFVTARISLDETKALARHFDVKLNDIVLATCAGALRRYFAKNPAVLAKSMVGAVPASLRAPGDTTQNNQVTMMLIDLATNQKDPLKRLAAITKSSLSAKMTTGAMKGVTTTVTGDLPTLGIPWLMSIITPLYKTAVASNRIPVVANVVISNVPGPPMPLYMAGAALREYYPVSIVTHGLALNITIQSYAGSLDYGFIAARDQVAKPERLAEYLQAAHEELMGLMAKQLAKRPPSEATPKKAAPKKPAARAKPAAKSTAKRVAKPAAKKVAKTVAARKKRA
ncbi:MAG: wax ester/triacylglycerol synthase family O-acyltransferase [Betaproteobacteria bacterium]|nr:wax ester/triacylglycerol synthase family O-acyltransferase [Betaproteobacteria bacterium]